MPSTERSTLQSSAPGPDPKIPKRCAARLPGAVVSLLAIMLYSTLARAETPLSIVVTSNLQGRFSTTVENQETEDPLLVLGQNIVFERNHGGDLYLDLGNALYPGILSKYSSGAIMMDFLDYFDCQALLVSSEDLQIGTKNLEFLNKSKKVRLLSSNIVQEDQPIFSPWFAIDRAGTRIAFIGISSEKIGFDIAEKELYNLKLVREKEHLEPIVNAIREAGIRHIILLSGLGLKDTATILEAFPDIDLALCGGDYRGQYFGGKAARLDLADGRPIALANDSADYFLLKLTVDDRLKLNAWEPKNVRPIPTSDYYYQGFKNNLSLWKEKFRAEQAHFITNLGDRKYEINDLRFVQLLRDRFDCELGIVKTGTISPSPFSRNIRRTDLIGMVDRDYNIFVFSLTGNELRTVANERDSMLIAGMDAAEQQVSVQGYPLEGSRRYRVAASQPAFDSIRRLLGRPIVYNNTWMTVTDLVREDLKKDRVILRDDFDYLDRRYRTTVDAFLANFVNNSTVDKGDSIDTPPGQPSQGYNKWGLENEIDLTVYNKYHRFVLTPYMLYSRQDEDYLNNILRGTLLYDYNLGNAIRPYGKFMCDTVVEQVDGQRPILLRGTLGASTAKKYVAGKLGLGFEKEVQDPANPALYGVELIVGVNVPFLSHFTYTFDLDTFSGVRAEENNEYQVRGEVHNTLFVAINSYLSLSFGHKFFYVYDGVSDENYRNSRFLTSLNLTHDWKFW